MQSLMSELGSALDPQHPESQQIATQWQDTMTAFMSSVSFDGDGEDSDTETDPPPTDEQNTGSKDDPVDQTSGGVPEVTQAPAQVEATDDALEYSSFRANWSVRRPAETYTYGPCVRRSDIVDPGGA